MKILGFILIGLFTALLIVFRSVAENPLPRHGVVLMYHHFGDSRHPSTNIRLEQFEAHLDHLETGGYRVWPLARLTRRLKSGQSIPDRVVAITVDDAYRSVYTEAYPRLKARGWPFTVFVASDGVDRHFQAYMNWDQLREMAANGATIANHSASHDHLTDRHPDETESAWTTRVRADIEQDQRRLTEELGTAPMLFAYPYGEYGPALLDLVTELGYTGFGQQSGAIGEDSDFAALPRFPLSERYGTLDAFRTKVATLPFPIRAVSPRSPILADADTVPKLTLRLAPTDARLDQLTCFSQGMGRAAVSWQNRADRRFSVMAERPQQGRRSRYNCTAPSPHSGRYYWYSHPWLAPPRKLPAHDVNGG